MSISNIIDEALTLKPQDRYKTIESLSMSLDVANPEAEEAWINESIKRAEAYKNGELKTAYTSCSDTKVSLFNLLHD